MSTFELLQKYYISDLRYVSIYLFNEKKIYFVIRWKNYHFIAPKFLQMFIPETSRIHSNVDI